MTELLSELRRSPVPGDRAVAELLDSLRPAEDRRPRASEGLAAFIAECGSGVTPPAELLAPAGSSSLLVVVGGAADPKPARRWVLTGVWAQVAVAAAVALVAVAVATGGPSRDVVVRPTDNSTTVAPATTPPADQVDTTPRHHLPVAPGSGSRPHRARSQPTATTSSTSDRAPSVRASTPAAGDEESARETEDEQESGDGHADETAGDPDDAGGETADDGVSTDDGETPDGVDD